jgi:N-carbamoylputrescine amidase
MSGSMLRTAEEYDPRSITWSEFDSILSRRGAHRVRAPRSIRAMNIAICQLQDGMAHDSLAWDGFAKRVERARPDLTVLNEMPFGPWIARHATFDAQLATESIAAHEAALRALGALPGAVLSYRPLHQKQYFPHETGFFEREWFWAERIGFQPFDFRGVRFGVLLCTELMFNERARHYRRQGVHVILVPRASGTARDLWHTAARMAAIVSGCYVLSSNRVSPRADAVPRFGGAGFAYSPTGELLRETSDAEPFATLDVDVDRVRHAQRGYPCYVRELGEDPAEINART